MSTFENSSDQKSSGVAPYDTLIRGPYHPSQRSILLIPRVIEAQARAYLTGFQGTFMFYDMNDPTEQNIRMTVMKALNTHYREEVWHLCDESGNLVGHQSRYTAGYPP